LPTDELCKTPPNRSGESQTVFHVDQDTIDATTAWDLRPELLRCLYSHGPDLWIDLNRVTFIDSTGLGMLVGVLKEARELKGDVHLLNTGREVRRILQVTGLHALFQEAMPRAAA
jgi:anti-sigma B factor antagonist